MNIEDKISSINTKKINSKNKIKFDITKVNNLFSNKESSEIKDNFKRKKTHLIITLNSIINLRPLKIKVITK